MNLGSRSSYFDLFHPDSDHQHFNGGHGHLAPATLHRTAPHCTPGEIGRKKKRIKSCQALQQAWPKAPESWISEIEGPVAPHSSGAAPPLWLMGACRLLAEWMQRISRRLTRPPPGKKSQEVEAKETVGSLWTWSPCFFAVPWFWDL